MENEQITEPWSSVGSLLRATRLVAGEGLDRISTILRIRRAYVAAIEEGNYQALPGAPYAAGFVRAYAKYLGLDSDEVVRRFRAESAGAHLSSELRFPSPMSDRGIPGAALMFVGVLVAVVAYGGWYLLTSENKVVAELVGPLPDRLAAQLTPSPSEPAQTPAAEPDAASVMSTEIAPASGTDGVVAAAPDTAMAAPPAPVAETPASTPSNQTAQSPSPATIGAASTQAAPAAPSARLASGATAQGAGDRPGAEASATSAAAPATRPASATDRVATASEPASVSTAAAPSEPAAPRSTSESRIVVRAKMPSWIQVRDETKNELLVTRMMRAGDTYPIPNQPGLTLMTGNAGALEIVVDGTAAPAVGPLGAVRHNVALDAKRLLDGTAVTE